MPHLCFFPTVQEQQQQRKAAASPHRLPQIDSLSSSTGSPSAPHPATSPIHPHSPVLPVFGIDTSIDNALNVFDEMRTRFMVLGYDVILMLQMPDRHLMDRIAWCLNML